MYQTKVFKNENLFHKKTLTNRNASCKIMPILNEVTLSMSNISFVGLTDSGGFTKDELNAVLSSIIKGCFHGDGTDVRQIEISNSKYYFGLKTSVK